VLVQVTAAILVLLAENVRGAHHPSADDWIDAVRRSEVVLRDDETKAAEVESKHGNTYAGVVRAVELVLRGIDGGHRGWSTTYHMTKVSSIRER
jgi:hypothetical protein